MDLKSLIPSYQRHEQETFKFKFTVFTPVYNCENTIERVHKSLLNQTFKDFEWLIINDGSSDNSNEIIEKIVETSPLNIVYINNPVNGHKMKCFIQAVSLAQGEFLLTFDGDDKCTLDALYIFNNEYENIPEHLKERLSAVTGLCKDQYGNQIGDSFPKDSFYSNSFQTHAIHKLKGEKWGFTKTSILKGIKVNPVILTKGFIPESLIWNLIAKEGYQTKYINAITRVYYIDVNDSLSSMSLNKRSFGSIINCIAIFNWFFSDNYLKAPHYFLKNIYVLLRASKYQSFSLKNYIEALNSTLLKILIITLWPFRKFMK